MSLISVRDRLRGPGLHRAADEVDRLREVNSLLSVQLVAAGDRIGSLQRELDDTRVYRAEAELVVVCLDATVTELRAELARVNGLLAPYLAAEATAGAVTVPDSERDTTAVEDQATAPIDVRPLWEAHGISPVIRVADAPALGDPRTPVWVPDSDSETTQSLRVIAA